MHIFHFSVHESLIICNVLIVYAITFATTSITHKPFIANCTLFITSHYDISSLFLQPKFVRFSCPFFRIFRKVKNFWSILINKNSKLNRLPKKRKQKKKEILRVARLLIAQTVFSVGSLTKPSRKDIQSIITVFSHFFSRFYHFPTEANSICTVRLIQKSENTFFKQRKYAQRPILSNGLRQLQFNTFCMSAWVSFLIQSKSDRDKGAIWLLIGAHIIIISNIIQVTRTIYPSSQ